MAAGGGRWNGPDGATATGTSTHQTWFSPAEVSVNNGLSLGLRYDPTYAADGWTTQGGVVTTWNKFSFTSGYVQISAEMPDSSTGQWPAIWLLPNNAPTGGSGGDEEIDMHEGGMIPTGYGYPSGTPFNNVLLPNYHEPDNVQPMVLSATAQASTPLDSGYHTYGMQVIGGQSVKFYLDGRLYATVTQGVTNEAWCIIMWNAFATANTAGYHSVGDPQTDATGTLKVAEVQVYS